MSWCINVQGHGHCSAGPLMEFLSGTRIFAGVVTSRPLVWFMPVRVILNCLGPIDVQWYNHWYLRPKGEFLLDLLIFCRHCNSWAAGYLKWFRTILCNNGCWSIEPLQKFLLGICYKPTTALLLFPFLGSYIWQPRSCRHCNFTTIGSNHTPF